MRAVNLIPADERSGGAPGLGKSGGAVYVVLGGLAVLVAMVFMWASAGSRVADDRAELAGLQAEAAAAQAQLQTVASVDDIRSVREARVATVRALAATRVDWADSLDAIARTLPADTWLDSLAASTTPASAAPGGTGGAGAVASSTTGPSIQVSGCSPSQARVARLMPRLRSVPGVERVSLVSAEKAAPAATGSPSSGCADVTFQMVLFFAAPVVPGAPLDPAAPAGTADSGITPVGAPPAATPAPVPASAPAGGTGQ
jgi:Tfp pilus assembly protein PilN